MRGYGMTTRFVGLVGLLWLGLLVGCGGEAPAAVESPAPPPTPTTQPVAEADAGEDASVSQPEPSPTSPDETPSDAPESTASSLDAGRYVLSGESRSTNAILAPLALELRSAEVAAGQLTIEVAFVNTGAERLNLIGARLTPQRQQLVDQSGEAFAAVSLSESITLLSDQSQGGIPPGGAKIGTLVFDAPLGPGPYTLNLATALDYAPLPLVLDTPLAEGSAPPPVAEGRYSINQALYSLDEVLQPLELAVEAVTITADELIFEIAFVNTSRQGFDLFSQLTGQDAWLIDSRLAYAPPLRVSAELVEGIKPAAGWGPGEAYAGQLYFPRPDGLEEVRFGFETYVPLTLMFDADGLQMAAITSATGGPPPEPLPPTAVDVAYSALNGLLAAEAEAFMAGDAPEFIDSVSYELVPGIVLRDSDVERGMLTSVDVLQTYRLRGAAADNPFMLRARYSFERRGESWEVTEVAREQRPFWLDPLVLTETEHFLIFAPPEAADLLPELVEEAEIGYGVLQEQGLTLENKSLMVYTADEEVFAELTGRRGRTLGVAFSMYTLEGEEILVTNRVFFINGAAFSGEDVTLEERQTTITHELVHLALAPQTRPFTPAWLGEGAAVYYAEQDADLRPYLLENGDPEQLSLVELTTVDALGQHDFVGTQVGLEYAYSGALFTYLVETYGEGVTRDFYAAFADLSAMELEEELPTFFANSFSVQASIQNLRTELTEENVEALFGVTLSELEAAFESWLFANS